MPTPGGQKFGKYILLDRMATGGMAEIYRARFVATAGVTKQVVIKKILPHFADNPHFVQMFINEARIAVGLTHGNIAQVFDFGEIDGEYFLAMELVDGMPLSKAVRRAGEMGLMLPQPLVVYVGIELCKGLAYAHAFADEQGRPVGLVHRDVSPQNVMITYGGEVKIVDFGIAKARSATGQETEHGALKGKYVYFSPEQARGKPIDHRSDLFSAGIVLYETLTGERPFTGKMIDVLGRIVRGEFAPPRALNSAIPEELEAIVLMAMARDRDTRYQSALELQDSLARYLASTGERPNQQSLANAAQFFFAKELTAEGRAPKFPRELADELSKWRRPKGRRTPGESDSDAATREARGHGGAAETRGAPPDRGPHTTPVSVPEMEPPGLRPRTALLVVVPLLAASIGLALVIAFARPAKVAVRVVGPPGAAEVWLDGRAVAKALPATFEARADRAHEIAVRVEGEPTFTSTVPSGAAGTVEIKTPFGDAARPRVVLGDAVEQRPAEAEAVRWPAGSVDVGARKNAFSVPASRAARMRLAPAKVYELTVEGQVTLSGARDPLHRVLWYAEPASGVKLGEGRFGSLGPGETTTVRGARALYGFVLDDRPEAAAGAMKIKVRDLAGRATAILLVDTARHGVAFPRGAAAKVAGLDPAASYRIEVAGSASLSDGDAVHAVVFHTDALSRNGEAPARGIADGSQGLVTGKKAAVIAGAESVEFALPDDGEQDNAGELTVSMTSVAASKKRR